MSVMGYRVAGPAIWTAVRRSRAGVAVLALGITASALGGCGGSPTSSQATASSASASVAGALLGLEHRYGARLGVYVLDTGTARAVAYRADERFGFASTYKALAAGILLRRVSDAELNRVITYRAADLQAYSPVTAPRVATGMPLREIIAAALRVSDNTAANLMLDQLGGPAGLQRAVRALGDATTHVDRTEPTVNQTEPGDVRDTSTPRAMGADLRTLVLSDLLPAPRRGMLTDWLVGNTTGGPYIRAGVPTGWKVGDKTGNGQHGTRNDIAVAWSPARAPVLIAVMSDRPAPGARSDDALIADATRAALSALP